MFAINFKKQLRSSVGATVLIQKFLFAYARNFHQFSVHVVGSCHHGMARPQVADRGTASDKEGSCEYIE